MFLLSLSDMARLRATPQQLRKAFTSPEHQDWINRLGEKTNLERYVDNRLEMLENVPDDLPEEVRLTVSIPIDAAKRLEYFAKLLGHSKSGLANDILEEAIYDLEEALCGDLFDDTESAKKHREALKIGEFAEEQKTKTKWIPIPVDKEGNFIWDKDGKDE